MADPRELFSVLKGAGGAGVPLDQAVDATTAAAALNGAVGFAYKDSTGKVVLPQLDSLGRIPVAFNSGTPMHANGSLAAGSVGSIVDITDAVITLTPSKVYSNIQWKCSCRQASLLQLVWNDNGVETVLDEAVVGPGQYTVPFELIDMEITAGATGTQELKVKGENFETASDLRATITALEAP